MIEFSLASLAALNPQFPYTINTYRPHPFHFQILLKPHILRLRWSPFWREISKVNVLIRFLFKAQLKVSIKRTPQHDGCNRIGKRNVQEDCSAFRLLCMRIKLIRGVGFYCSCYKILFSIELMVLLIWAIGTQAWNEERRIC